MAFYQFEILVIIINLVIIKQVLSVDEQVDKTDEFLNNLKLTHFDDWGTNITCPPSLFITGLKLRHVKHENSNYINGIQILCSNEVYASDSTQHSTIIGRPGGEWHPIFKCKSGFALGLSISLSSVATSGSSISKLEIFCSDDPQTIKVRDSGTKRRNDQQNPSEPREFIEFCEPGDALVGIHIKADSIITFDKGDTASIKGISIECNVVNNPITYEKIKYDWEEKIHGMTCNESKILKRLAELPPPGANVSETILINCSFSSWTGIGPNSNLRDAEHSIAVYNSVGINNNEEFVKLNLLKRLMSIDVKKWFLKTFPHKPHLLQDFAAEWLPKNVANYEGAMSFKIKRYPIPINFFRKQREAGKLNLKHDPVFEQYVGNCGIYQISFPMYRVLHQVYFDQRVKKRMTRFIFETL